MFFFVGLMGRSFLHYERSVVNSSSIVFSFSLFAPFFFISCTHKRLGLSYVSFQMKSGLPNRIASHPVNTVPPDCFASTTIVAFEINAIILSRARKSEGIDAWLGGNWLTARCSFIIFS